MLDVFDFLSVTLLHVRIDLREILWNESDVGSKKCGLLLLIVEFCIAAPLSYLLESMFREIQGARII